MKNDTRSPNDLVRRRRRRNVVCLFSAITLAAVVALWVRSAFRTDILRWARTETSGPSQFPKTVYRDFVVYSGVGAVGVVGMKQITQPVTFGYLGSTLTPAPKQTPA